MAIECGVIALMLIGMAILFFTRKHKQWGWATLPLTLVPLTHFVVMFVLVGALHMEISLYVGILILLCAVAVSCAWVGFVSTGLKHKSTRLTYLGIANAFSVILAAILIHNILEVIREYGEILK